MFAWLSNLASRNPIATLRSGNKDAWCRKYFPEYADLHGGKYPPSLRVVYAERGAHVRFSGRTRVLEIAPWEYNDGSDGRIDELGWKWQSNGLDQFGRPAVLKTPASEDEYIAWCDSRNFYRSGNGLDPALLVGAVDRRDSEYTANLARYREDEKLPVNKRILLTDPDKLVSPYGVLFPERGPGPTNPWGVNSSFHPRGDRVPSYVSKRWGPDYRPDSVPSQFWHRQPIIYFDPAVNGPRPSQEEYDKARYSVWL